MPYDAGNTVRVRATFTDVDTSVPIDPGTVDFNVYSPSGAETPVTPAHDGTGRWSISFVAAAGGVYTVAVNTTDPVCASQRRIQVNPVPV
jgi:uncharacterized protein YfaS (alpha-2-macroglobulin family)